MSRSILFAVGTVAFCVLFTGAVACGSSNGNTAPTSVPTVASAPASVSTVRSATPAVPSAGGLTVRTATPAVAAAAGAQTQTEVATDNKYSSTTLTASANKPIAFTLTNNGTEIHNWHVLDTKDANGKDIQTSLLPNGKSDTITFTIAKAGTYHFQCDVHPDEMKGTLTIN